MTRRVTIDGFPVEIVTDAEAETADMMICIRWTMPPMYPDNQRGTCSRCGHAVQFRPYAPKRPARVCVNCAAQPVH